MTEKDKMNESQGMSEVYDESMIEVIKPSEEERKEWVKKSEDPEYDFYLED